MRKRNVIGEEIHLLERSCGGSIDCHIVPIHRSYEAALVVNDVIFDMIGLNTLFMLVPFVDT